MPTTASTATIRAWAHAEGLDVAERSRLKPEILEAYQAAHTRKSAAKATPAKSTPSASKSRVSKTAPKPSAKAVRPVMEALLAEPSEREASAALGADVVKLQAAVEALTVRVSQLEAASTQTAGRRKFGRKS